jgi:polar amino acid transport system substrate-binding protein
MRAGLALLVGTVIAAFTAAASALDMRLGYPDQAVPPFLIGHGAEVPAAPGIAIELVQRALREAGGEPVFSRMPLVRAEASLRAGRLDGLPCVSYTAERAAFLVYPTRNGKPDAVRRCASLNYVLYQHKGGQVAWDGHTVRANGPVGIVRGSSIAESLRAMGLELVEVNNDEQLFGMLDRGRIAAIATLENLGDRHLRLPSEWGHFEKLAPPLSSTDYYLAVTTRFYARHPDFVERLWRRIGALRDPVYRELAPRYLP